MLSGRTGAEEHLARNKAGRRLSHIGHDLHHQYQHIAWHQLRLESREVSAARSTARPSRLDPNYDPPERSSLDPSQKASSGTAQHSKETCSSQVRHGTARSHACCCCAGTATPNTCQAATCTACQQTAAQVTDKGSVLVRLTTTVSVRVPDDFAIDERAALVRMGYGVSPGKIVEVE